MQRKNWSATRGWIMAVGLLVALGGAAGPLSAAETFPARPVELIVPYPPGGGTDIVARLIGEAAEPFLKQKAVVINKPGGSGTIGLTLVTEARPDAYTLACISNAPLTMAPNVLRVTFTPDNFSYITMLAKGAQVFAVRTDFPAKTAAEFFDLVGKNPGKYTYAGDGVGNIVHYSGERVFQPLKLKLRFVPYGGGGETIKAVLGGHVDVYGGSVPVVMPHIKAGKIRPLFVTTKERVDSLPETPGTGELGGGAAETAFWRAILGPKGLPADRVTVLEKAFQQAVQTPKVKAQLAELGEAPELQAGKAFEQHVRQETAEMAAAAKQLGLSPK
jgi:tripartite-type tricarboxylate transporter receptor subunit TctC